MSRQITRALFVSLLLFACLGFAQTSGELHFFLHTEPKTFEPAQVADDASETVRYLTGGVLIRVNRQTQALEPELATSWKVSNLGKTISFKLRHNVYFADGSPFSADDVAFTMKQLMDPALHSPTGDSFRSAQGDPQIQVQGKDKISITFPAPVVALDRLFDQVAIVSAKNPTKHDAVLGPFYVADYKPGAYVLLKRNSNYWKKDEKGRQLPYLSSVRLDIQPNRDIEMMKFRRGEIQLINALDTEFYDKLASTSPDLVHDAGPSLDSEQMWFNQVPTAPIPDYKKAWFRSTDFRRAISEAINREDLCRVVFGSHARPAVGPVSPANKLWFNTKLHAEAYDPQQALARLKQAGFTLQNGALRDAQGHAVEFSIITNSGNKPRERMATMMQQDLARIGIKLNVVTLDFPSLIERITSSFNYESAMLGLTNVDPDPSAQMNVWLSSAENHQWNPSEKSPATAWEAEIDKLMQQQSSALDLKKRKAAFDKVQEIVYEQAPFIYLVNKNALSAASPAVSGMAPVVLRPQTYWNIDRLDVRVESARSR